MGRQRLAEGSDGRSVKATIPGAFGTDFGRGGRSCATAVIGTSIHAFSVSVRQYTSAKPAAIGVPSGARQVNM